MLTILNDPAGVTGRHRHAWDYGLSIHENIAQHMRSGSDCRVLLNGIEIDPATDPAMDRLPTIADGVTVVRRPEGFDPFTWLLIAVVASAVVTYALMPKPPDMGATGKDSPNNRLTAQSNTARAYQAIPDVYGYRRVWPDMIQPSTVEYIDHIKYVTEWLCISRGWGDITDVQYAETPIADISGASFEVFEPTAGAGGYPERGTTTINDVLETFASEEVNGQELEPAVPAPVINAASTLTATSSDSTYSVTLADGPTLDRLKALVPSGTARVVLSDNSFEGLGTIVDRTSTVLSFSVSGGNCTFVFSGALSADYTALSLTAAITPNDTALTTIGPFTLPIDAGRIRWNTVFPRGLKGSVVIRAEWWRIDADGVEVPGTRQQQDDTYTADTFDARYYTKDVTPAAGVGRYRVQFTRQTAELGSNGADVAKLEEVYAVRHYPTKSLPGVTVIRVTTKATNEATGFSDRKFNLRWHRLVRTLTSNSLSTSRNFARIMAHIWTLAGNDIAALDTAALAAINTEFGETSALLRFDGSLDDADMSLGERLQLVANHARCIVWRDGQKWTVTRDQARAYPEMQFDYRNLAAGGESSIGYASHLPASHDGVEVEYVDENTQAKKAYVRLSIASGSPVTGAGINPKKFQLPGCTSEAQATNRAQLEARRLLYQRVSVQDTALSDASALGLGALVRWVDPSDFGGIDDALQAGEVRSIAGSVITTSEALDWQGQTTGRVLLTGADGRYLGAPVLCTPVTGGLQLSTVPAGIYTADTDRQLGSRYVFAPGLTEAELEAAGLYTVTEIKPSGDGAVSLSLAQYDSRIYSAD